MTLLADPMQILEAAERQKVDDTRRDLSVFDLPEKGTAMTKAEVTQNHVGRAQRMLDCGMDVEQLSQMLANHEAEIAELEENAAGRNTYSGGADLSALRGGVRRVTELIAAQENEINCLKGRRLDDCGWATEFVLVLNDPRAGHATTIHEFNGMGGTAEAMRFVRTRFKEDHDGVGDPAAHYRLIRGSAKVAINEWLSPGSAISKGVDSR